MATIFQLRPTSVFQAVANILRRNPSPREILCKSVKVTATETHRSTDNELLRSVYLPDVTAETRKEDMEKQLRILQNISNQIDAILPIPGPATEEPQTKEQLATKIKTLRYLTNVQLTLIANAAEIAMYPVNYAPPNLLCIRRQWLAQRALHEMRLEAANRYLKDREAEIYGSETFAPLVEEHEDIVFGSWPLALAELEWEFVENP